MTLPISKLAALRDKIRASQESKILGSNPSIVLKDEPTVTTQEPAPDKGHIYDKYGNLITLNSKQLEFVSLATEGRSCVLIGAAGTGKTTSQKAVVSSLIQSGRAGILSPEGHKYLPQSSPGIVIVAYTRRAVANIRRNMPTDLQNNCITIHKLLEYQPVYTEVIDPITGDTKTKMSFEPARNSSNPLPSSIHTIIFEESSMIGTDLYKEVQDATPHNPQEIFLGDIQQLPPVFGPAILGFKLLQLPVVELTEVYRQALESPIISLAHRILSGNPIPPTELKDWNSTGLTIHPWKKKISPETALQTTGMFFIQAEEKALYDPEEDIILIPFNKSFGTDELNKILANHLSKKRGATTYEIIEGFNKYYLSPGDKILYDKEDATILEINPNPSYTGATPLPASKSLDYWGYDPTPPGVDAVSDDDMDFLLSQVSSSESGDRVRQASHVLTIQMLDSGVTVKVDKAADINTLNLGYVLTVHRSQGSEFRKVFFVTHQSHNTMMSRELIYTAVTRAREELYVIGEPEMFVGGILSQRIKGNTLQEKALQFQGKLEEGKDYSFLTRGSK